MRRVPLIVLLLSAIVMPGAPGSAADLLPGTRVIVSNTLNGTLAFFDPHLLTETQPPLPVRGTSPVRLWVQRFEGKTFLFSANHGIEGSIGVYDLDRGFVTEMPASPFPAGPGAVGVSAGEMVVAGETVPMVFATNTTFALGGCGMPTGSLTAYTARGISAHGLLQPAGTVALSGPIPYAVDVDPTRGLAYASVTCSDTLDTIAVERADVGAVERHSLAWMGSRTTGDGPDAVVFDPEHELLFVTNIAGSSVSVFDPESPSVRTTVPMPGARPIDANLADSTSGARWLATSNGGNDSIGLVDRDIAAACAAAAAASCPQAYVLEVPTGVAGGAPEGIDFHTGSNRVFTVNKNIGNPTLSVIQISEDGGLSGAPIARLPLGALGTSTPVPAFIAFDVVVER